MNIVVCVKRVPDTASRIQIGPDKKGLDPSGIEYIVSPFDEYGVEYALQLKEAHGGEVTILSLGGQEVETTIRGALAMGADAAIRLDATGPFGDPLSTARALADALKEIPHDILFFGMQAADDDSAQVGTLVARMLSLPNASMVVEVELHDGKLRAHREVEGGHEIVELPMPCVITTQKGEKDPRYASLKGIMAAKKKEIQVREVALGEPALEIVKMELPPERPPGRIVGEGAEAVPELIRLLQEEAKVI